MNAARLGRIERLILMASSLLAMAIAMLWFRSLLVNDELDYTPASNVYGNATSAEWEFSSGGGALQIIRFRQIDSMADNSNPFLLTDLRHSEQGWKFSAPSPVGTDIVTAFLNGLKNFGASHQNDPAFGTTWGIRFPYAVPFLFPIIPAAIIWIRWRKRQQTIRKGFTVEPKK